MHYILVFLHRTVNSREGTTARMALVTVSCQSSTKSELARNALTPPLKPNVAVGFGLLRSGIMKYTDIAERYSSLRQQRSPMQPPWCEWASASRQHVLAFVWGCPGNLQLLRDAKLNPACTGGSQSTESAHQMPTSCVYLLAVYRWKNWRSSVSVCISCMWDCHAPPRGTKPRWGEVAVRRPGEPHCPTHHPYLRANPAPLITHATVYTVQTGRTTTVIIIPVCML
jgi:hypothetical protein